MAMVTGCATLELQDETESGLDASVRRSLPRRLQSGAALDQDVLHGVRAETD